MEFTFNFGFQLFVSNLQGSKVKEGAMTYREPTIREEKCGQMLNEAVKIIATRERRKLESLDEEFGFLCGVAGKTFERYRHGGSHPEERSIEIFVPQLVGRASVDEKWIEAFLSVAGYPAAKKAALINRFFGDNREQDQPASIDFSPFEQTTQINELQVKQALYLAAQVGFCYKNTASLNILNSTHNKVVPIILWLYRDGQYHLVIQLANDTSYYFYVKGLWPQRVDVSLLAAKAALQIENYAQEISALAYLVQTLSRQGELSRAKPHLTRLLELEAIHPIPADIQVEMQSAVALYAMQHNDFDTAIASLNTAIKYAYQEQVPIPKSIIAHRIMGEAMYRKGNLTMAQKLFQDVLETAIQIGHARAAALAILNLAAIHIDTGELKEAEPLLQTGTEQARSNFDLWCTAEAYKLWGRLHLHQGSPDKSIRPLSQAREGFRQLGMLREYAEAETLIEQCMS